jgi:hypothetical protein
MDDIIRNFLESSIDGTLDEFDFDDAFSNANYYLYNKLAEHGLLDYDEFLQVEEDIWGTTRGDLEEYATRTGYISISVDELYDVVMKYRYNRFRKTFIEFGSFRELLDLYERINDSSMDDMSIAEKAILFDECIHAQHETGDVFDDIDIESIKAEIDAKYATKQVSVNMS